MEMSEVKNGMRVRHITSGEILTVVSTPFWFDGEPTVTLQDKRGQARMTKLSGLEAIIEKTEGKK